MGLIKKQVREEKQSITLRLEIGVMKMLTEYAEYLEGTKDYVVSSALKYVCGKDAEFQASLQAKNIMAVLPAESSNGKRKKQPGETPSVTATLS